MTHAAVEAYINAVAILITGAELLFVLFMVLMIIGIPIEMAIKFWRGR